MTLFRGWVVVAAVFVALAIIFGVAYSFSAFFSSFQREFSAARGDVSSVFALCGLIYFTLGAVTGSVADRIGPRWLVLAGFVILAGGLFAASRATSLSALYATYSIGVGLGVGCVYVPAVAAVQPWFIRRRALASGLAASGIGVGTLVVPLIVVWIIEASDWRRAFEWMAAGSLALGLVAGLLIDNAPSRHGLYPDGAAHDPLAGAPKQVPRGISLRKAARTRAFWLLYAAMTLFSVGLFIPFVHLAPYARDAGHTQQIGVMLIGLIGVGSIIGRFGLAGLGDRFERRALLAAVYAGAAAMLVLWMASTGVVALALFALAFGTFYGTFVALHPPLAMDFFGGRSVAGIIGCLYTAAGIGNLIGPTLAGFAYDLSGSYALPIAASSALMLGSLACALLLRGERSYV